LQIYDAIGAHACQLMTKDPISITMLLRETSSTWVNDFPSNQFRQYHEGEAFST